MFLILRNNLYLNIKLYQILKILPLFMVCINDIIKIFQYENTILRYLK
jgi:hypothetical protein